MKKILMPLPHIDFDPTETAVPWSHLHEKGYEIYFATPDGEPGEADGRMVTGKGLGILSGVLMARKDDVRLYNQMTASSSFRSPIKYDKIKADSFDALLLPGGHAKGMRVYLESEILQKITAAFFAEDRPVAAICHGVLLAARSTNPKTGKSVLFGKRTTSLLRSQEMLAWNLTRSWLDDYYRTYPMPLQTEVESLLAKPEDFIEGPVPIARDTFKNPSRGFTLREGNYLSARWPGDAHKFAIEIPDLIG